MPTGPASFQSAGSTDWTALLVNYTVTTGDSLYTDQQSRAEIEIGTLAVRLSGTTDVTLTNLTDHLIQLGIVRRAPCTSACTAWTRAIPSRSTRRTARSPRRDRATTAWRSRQDNVDYRFGRAREPEATGPGLATSLRAGQTIEFAGVSAITTCSVSAHPAPTAFDQWSADRDHRLAASGCTRYVTRHSPVSISIRTAAGCRCHQWSGVVSDVGRGQLGSLSIRSLGMDWRCGRHGDDAPWGLCAVPRRPMGVRGRALG